MSKPLLALLLLACSATSQAASTTPEPIETTVKQCETCHSNQHNQAAVPESIAPILDGMSDDYIEQQLANFQMGYRTVQGPDAERIQQAHAKETIDGDALSLIADYYDELELRFNDITLTDTSINLDNGEALFEDQCASCHTSAFGRWVSDGPEITQLEAPYILRQLNAMQSNQRTFMDETKHHRKMVERLKKMSTQDLIDIVGYINQNARSL